MEKQTNGDEANFAFVIPGDTARQAGSIGSSVAWFAHVFVLPKVNGAGIQHIVRIDAIAVIVTAYSASCDGNLNSRIALKLFHNRGGKF
jgi:hypothetical protein